MKVFALVTFLVASGVPPSVARLNNMRTLYRVDPASKLASNRVHSSTINEGFTAEDLRELVYEEMSMPLPGGIMSYPLDEGMSMPLDGMSYPLDEGMSYPLDEGMSLPYEGMSYPLDEVVPLADDGSDTDNGANDRAVNPSAQTETTPAVDAGSNNTPKIAGSVVAVVAVLATAGVAYRFMSKRNGAATEVDAASLSSADTGFA